MNILDTINKNPNQNFFISASAGTGKTYTLTQYYISILEKNYPDDEIVDKILAVTFTNKAAGEMRERILQAVYDKINILQEKNVPEKEIEYWNNIRINLSRAWIKTIDSFCSKILRDNNIIIGIDPNFTMISEFKKDKEIEKAIYYSLKTVLELYENKKPEDINMLSSERKNKVNIIISEIQKNPLRFKETLHNILKDPGMDKLQQNLKTIVSNWRLEMERSIIFEEFPLSNKELEEIYIDYIWLFKILSNLSKEYYENFTIDNFQYDFKGTLEKTLKALSDEYILRKYQNRFKYIIVDEYQDTNYLQKELFEKLHTNENHLFYVGDRKQSIYRFRGADVSVFSKSYDEFKKNNYTIGALSTNRRSNSQIVNFANEISKQTLFKKENIYIDDVDSLLIDNTSINDDDICHFEEDDKEVITPKLSKDDKYRIKIIKAIPEKNNAEQRKELEITAMIKTIKKLIGQEMSFRERKNGKIQQIKRKIQAKDIAILLRQMTGYEDIIKKEFSKNNIPFYIIGGKSFYFREEIQSLLTALSAVQNPYNDFEFTRYMFSLIGTMTFEEYDKLINEKNELNKKSEKQLTLFETFQISKEENNYSKNTKKAFETLKKYKDLKYYIKPTNILKGIVEENNYISKLSALDESEIAISNVKKLINEAEKYNTMATSFAELVRLLKKATDVNEEEAVLEDENSNSVKILTIHKSKGLEFPIVIMGGLHSNIDKKDNSEIEFSLPDLNGNRYFLLKNIFKDVLKESENDILRWFKNNTFLEKTENNRLIYVGITRPKELLIPINVENKNKTTYNIFFDELKYKDMDIINIEEIEDIFLEKIENDEEKEKKLVPQINLKDLKNNAYKQYIAPTYLTGLIDKPSEINDDDDENIIEKVNFKKDELFSNQELIFRGSDLHRKLQSVYNLSQIKNMIENSELPNLFDQIPIVQFAFNTKNKIIKNEWRLVKNFKINDKDYMLFGIPDKVIIHENNIYIIDYKYSNLNQNIDKYRFQINFYLYLLKDFGIPKKGYLLSIKENNKFIEIDYDKNIEQKIIELIKNNE
jgi:ATP-dependent helicase/nuclease subunit A